MILKTLEKMRFGLKKECVSIYRELLHSHQSVIKKNVHIESELIRVYREKLGHSSLDNFGVASYDNPSITTLMLNYWRSHAAVRYLVEDKFQGAIHLKSARIPPLQSCEGR